MVIGPSFVLKGFEPPAVRTAIRADRLAFWTAVSGFVAEAKAEDLEAGLDKNGRDFVPLRPKTIKYRRSAMGPADPNGPALQPAHGLSRTRSLFRAQVTDSADGVVCYWAFDSHTGDSWGEILDYHRMGAGALPVRDVFGLSPRATALVKRRGEAWWRGYVLGNSVILPPMGGPGPKPTPMPTGGPPVFQKRGSGWGKRVGGTIVRIKNGGGTYDLIGGLGFTGPPRPGPGPRPGHRPTPGGWNGPALAQRRQP